jgi:hypothetical protein
VQLSLYCRLCSSPAEVNENAGSHNCNFTFSHTLISIKLISQLGFPLLPDILLSSRNFGVKMHFAAPATTPSQGILQFLGCSSRLLK